MMQLNVKDRKMQQRCKGRKLGTGREGISIFQQATRYNLCLWTQKTCKLNTLHPISSFQHEINSKLSDKNPFGGCCKKAKTANIRTSAALPNGNQNDWLTRLSPALTEWSMNNNAFSIFNHKKFRYNACKNWKCFCNFRCHDFHIKRK